MWRHPSHVAGPPQPPGVFLRFIRGWVPGRPRQFILFLIQRFGVPSVTKDRWRSLWRRNGPGGPVYESWVDEAGRSSGRKISRIPERRRMLGPAHDSLRRDGHVVYARNRRPSASLRRAFARLPEAPGEVYGASSASEAVPDVVNGRRGPAPGHLCPRGPGRPREPVSVTSAVGPGSYPASVGLCRLIDSSGRSRVSRASFRPQGVVPDRPGPPTGAVSPVASPAGNTVDGGLPRRSLRSSNGNSEKPGRPAGSRLSCGAWSTTFGGPLR
jgi:hypothetical protein